MANMAHCRFSNTVTDLQDCYDHIDDDLRSDAEIRAHARLVTLCRQIAALFDDEADDALDEAEERIAELEAVLARHAERSIKVDAAMMRKDFRIAELEKHLQFAVSLACQSSNHTKRSCHGHLWVCPECDKVVCCAEGTDDNLNMCDSCWQQEQANG